MRRSRTAFSAVVVAGALILSLTGAATPGAGDAPPHGGPPNKGISTKVLKRQAALDRLASQIADVREDLRYTIPGYSGIVLDPEAGVLNLYWKGDLPPRVDTVLKNAPRELKTTVHQAPYAAAELEAARQRLVAATDNTRAAIQGDNVISSVSLAEDGSGLRLGYTSPALTAQSARAAQTGTALVAPETPAVQAKAEEIAGVRVSVAVANRAERADYFRQEDLSPFLGGAALTTPTGMYCSTGFAVRDLQTGIDGLLTAEHCGTTGWFSTGNNVPIGQGGASRVDRDVTVINIARPFSSDPLYYDGGWDSSYAKFVFGSNDNWVGDYVCTSGAMSGIHCGNQVHTVNATVFDDGGFKREGLAIAKRTNPNDVAVAKGDSGGPVVAPINDEWFMEARGTISGGNERAVCSAPTAIPSVLCFTEVSYSPIRRTYAEMGLELQVYVP